MLPLLWRESMQGTYLHSPLNGLTVRNDPTGLGEFGTNRSRMIKGDRVYYRHNGVDIAGEEHDPVYAPCDCTIVRIGVAYRDPMACDLRLVVLEWELGRMKLMYLDTSVRKSDQFFGGEQIGELMSVKKYHRDNRMQDHIHWEILARSKSQEATNYVNPLMFFGKDDVDYMKVAP